VGPAFAKSISSACVFFNSPITLPISLTELAPSLAITSAHNFLVSSSPSCFGKKPDKISSSFCSTSKRSVLLFFL
jgi:hypothetical protein